MDEYFLWCSKHEHQLAFPVLLQRAKGQQQLKSVSDGGALRASRIARFVVSAANCSNARQQ
jgi:hypothetical protein